MSHFFRRIKPFLATVLLSMVFCGHASDQVVIRKNIDDLSPQELTAYKHALQLLVDKSAKNVYDPEGFLWQAWVHNCSNLPVPNNGDKALEEQVWPTADIRYSCSLGDAQGSAQQSWVTLYQQQKLQSNQGATYQEQRGFPGQCQHHSDVFFPWHRAQFYYFERLLQLTDPDGNIPDSQGVAVSTKNVAVPYWNFTQPPSGNRFPKVFEDENSVLWAPLRKSGRLTKDNMPNYTSPELIAHFVESNWQKFGGYPNGDPFAAMGAVGPDESVFVLGEGLFESSVHDLMHDDYVGGYLSSPSTAGLDPLFYSFHAYIDLIYEEWLQQHGTQTVTSYQRVLRAQQPDIIPNPAGWPGYSPNIDLSARQDMGRGEIYFDTSEVGYIYKFGFKNREKLQLSARQKLIDSEFGVDASSPLTQLMRGRSGTLDGKPIAVQQTNFSIPAADTDVLAWLVSVARKHTQQDYSYRQQIYIHPKALSEQIKTEINSGSNGKLMDKYFANDTGYWQMGSHGTHAHGPVALNANISSVIEALQNQGLEGQEWTLSAGIFSSDEKANLADFSAPKLHSIKSN